jgi:hypothetical protein
MRREVLELFGRWIWFGFVQIVVDEKKKGSDAARTC